MIVAIITKLLINYTNIKMNCSHEGSILSIEKQILTNNIKQKDIYIYMRARGGLSLKTKEAWKCGVIGSVKGVGGARACLVLYKIILWPRPINGIHIFGLFLINLYPIKTYICCLYPSLFSRQSNIPILSFFPFSL